MSMIIQLIALLNICSQYIVKLWHMRHNYLLGCQMVQLDPFLESKMATNQRDFGQYLTFVLDWLESCNTITASVAEWLRAWDTLTMFEATVCGRS